MAPFFSLFSAAALVAALIMLALSTLALIRTNFAFWPPPGPKSWQNRLFRFLFRVMFYCLVIATILRVWLEWPILPTTGVLVATVLLVGGFIIALAATSHLGWGNAFGSREGLRTDGIFRYSRNPIYVATWFALGGWGILVPSPLIISTLAVWSLLYLVAIFLEERWLLNEYGSAFEDYQRRVRRFF